MANAQTTRTPGGGPYRRQLVVFQAQHTPRFSLALAGLHHENASAVRVAAVIPDARPPLLRFEPGHPDADGQGYVAYLRILFDCSLVSAEHLTYRDYLQSIPENAYLATCDLSPVGVAAVLQVDLAIAFPIIDLLLGGEGKGGDLGRPITEIEEQLLESILRIICRELQTTWQAIALVFEFGQRQSVAQALHVMRPDEKNLCLSFEVKMPDTRGTLNLAVPAVVSNALLRKISADCSYRRPHGANEARQRIQEKLLDCSFPVELCVPHPQLPLPTVADLAPGKLLSFSRSASAPAVLLVDEIRLGLATPVRVNSRRAARVLSLEPPSVTGGEP